MLTLMFALMALPTVLPAMTSGMLNSMLDVALPTWEGRQFGPLFDCDFERPIGHMPYAQFQPKPLLPHAKSFIVAEVADITLHVARSHLAGIPYSEPGAGESPDLLKAASWVAATIMDGKDVNAIRHSRIATFARIMAESFGRNSALTPYMSETVYPIAKGYDIHAMWWAARQMNYPDVEMCAGFVNGFKLVGNLWPPTYIHRAKLTQATMDSEACHHSGNKRMIGSIRRRGLKAKGDALKDLTECYAKTVQEVEEGWMEGPFSFSDLVERFPEGFWVMQRNPHRRYASAPVRPVDDGKRSGHNKCTTAHESIQCENADYGCRMAAIFRGLLGPTELKIGTDDLKKAFRQIPCSQARFNIVAIWNPSKQRVEFFIIRGFPFGCLSSVLHFNRLPRFIVHLLRRFFGVCVTHFYDDYCVAEPASTAHSAQYCVRRVHEILGFVLDHGKHIRAAISNPFLGVITDFSSVRKGIVIVRIQEERRAKIVDLLEDIIVANKLTPSHASSVRGKLYFSACTCFGRVGVPALQAFVKRQYGKGTRLTPALVAAIYFFISLLTSPMPRLVHIKRKTRSALRIWSDAMLQDGIGRLGFAFYDPDDSSYFFSSFLVPAWMLAMFRFPTHCIGQLEIMAALFVYITIEKFDVSRLKDRDVLHWVDNTSAIFGLYKGYSASDDSSRLIQIFHLLMAKLNFRTWWEYVASKANIADLPSRGDFTLLLQWGAIWLEPVWMTQTMYEAPFLRWLVAFRKRVRSRISGGAQRRARALRR